MKILHFIEAHTVHTERIARRQRAAGHEVLVATSSDRVGGPGVHVLPRGPRASRLPYAHHWQGIGAFRRLVRLWRPDLVHGHYLSTAGLYLAVCHSRPVVASAMGSDVLIDTRAAHARALIRASPRWVDRYTSVAPHLTRRMVDLGIPKESISTFPWGIDLSVFHPPSDPPDRSIVVSTRGFEPVYDVTTVVSAFTNLAVHHDGSRLVLYGDGSLRSALLDQIRREGIGRRVDLMGRADSETLSRGLGSASVYVSTSLSDGTSTSLLEAMATGLVPVVTDVEANREWVSDGENGLRFPPRDVPALERALERALTDDALRARARAMNPKLVAERGSLDTSIHRLDEVYRTAVA